MNAGSGERSVPLPTDVRREARHAQLLAAGGIELGQFGDRRHLAQAGAAHRSATRPACCRPRKLRGPAELAFDLVDELADLGGGRIGLLTLDADREVLCS